ncbi:penicillin-binding protein 2 [Candidatus Poribacteria bacterium]|nr:penicillin-binding protein 2 [Candidatus Poribacteria bacterium]
MKNNSYLSIRRLVFTLIVLQLGFLVLIAKLFLLQYPNEDTPMKSRKDWRSRSKHEVKRGKILDRYGSVLAISQDQLAVCADPKTFNRKSNAHIVAAELAPLLNTTNSELLAQLKRKRNGEYVEFVYLKKSVDYDKLDAIRDITKKHRGLKVEVEPNRVYPKKTLAAQVIGYLNDLNAGEGIEYQYNTYLEKLHSPQYQRSAALTSAGLQTQSTTETLGNSGCNVVLTLDQVIQDIVEKELAEGCKDWNAPKGTAIVLAVETSEILAMASYPTYDINCQTNADEEAKRNLGIWYLFEPGSIFKIIASSAVLNESIMTPESTVFCHNGRYRIGKRRVIKDVSGKGWLSLEQVIQKSSNIGMIKIVQELGPELFETYVDRYGFGEKTGIDLPYEQRGNLYALRRWDTNSLGAVPFGQGISVTPLQMVNALAVIANGGILHRPYITKEIRDAQGNLIKKNRPAKIRRVLRPEIAKQMTDILVGVVEKGSGMKAKIEGISIAGKTGTAQKAEKGKGYAAGKEVMSFMGFLPADAPKIAIIVTLDEPTGERFSGRIVAPIFKRIAKQTLKHIEQTHFFDSTPKRKSTSDHKYVDGNGTVTRIANTQLSNQPPNKINTSLPKKGKTGKTGHSLIKHTPISDDTLVRKGEGL